MAAKVYVETSIISYLTSRPSRDIIVAAQQQVTRQWWDQRRSQFDPFVSQLVVQEAEKGDAEAAELRLAVIEELPLLELPEEGLELAALFLKSKVLPEKAADDALHIALSTVYGLDYLLTWNCKHIANAEIQRLIAKISIGQGYETPVICTPMN